jgi:hypothetical protein
MCRNLVRFACLVILSLTCCGQVQAVGEDVLARCGEYTFFINPNPGSHVTYYKRMVPCRAEKTIPVPRRVFQTYFVPVAQIIGRPMLISETPIGHAKGVGPHVQCFPGPRVTPAIKEVIEPRPVPVRVPDLVLQPRRVVRPVMLPQWFAVQEHPKPPPAKVRASRAASPTMR